MCSDKIPHSSFIPFRDDVRKVVCKDDDENSSGCTRPSTGNTKVSRPPPRNRRIRKLLASKYWKAAPKLNDGELSHIELRPLFRNRRACYTRQRSERNFFKRRRMFERRSTSTSEGGTCSDGFSKSSKMVFDGNSTGSASRSSSPAAGQSPSSFHPRDSHVKLSIKSFRVLELFIEIPESTTIGSLKRTVMEAVNAILRGGLRVGVVFQGKKVREDNKTLLQSGIANDDKQGALGGRYEPPPPAGHAAAASFGASATAKISVDASLAGAIIGKGGVNSKQICRVTGAKLSIREHKSDPNLKNIELEGTFDQIKQAIGMVRELIVNIGAAAGNAKSHAAPAPVHSANNFKTKMCEKFAKGSCTFGERCHFAHGANELCKPGV